GYIDIDVTPQVVPLKTSIVIVFIVDFIQSALAKKCTRDKEAHPVATAAEIEGMAGVIRLVAHQQIPPDAIGVEIGVFPRCVLIKDFVAERRCLPLIP